MTKEANAMYEMVRRAAMVCNDPEADPNCKGCPMEADSEHGYCIADAAWYLAKYAEQFRKERDELEKKQTKYRWHDLRKNPEDLPDAETEVEVVCRRLNRDIRTHGFYEDGSVHTEDSDWFWEDIDCYGTYCEETDDYIIPGGWFAYNHYMPDGSYNGAIDDAVIAWRDIEPFEEVE